MSAAVGQCPDKSMPCNVVGNTQYIQMSHLYIFSFPDIVLLSTWVIPRHLLASFRPSRRVVKRSPPCPMQAC